MPNIDTSDLKMLAFPKGMRERYAALAWSSQRQYFVIMIAAGALLFLVGALS